MSTGPELPPAADETGREEVPPSATLPPAGGSGTPGALPGVQPADPSQFTHESKLPPLRLEDSKRRLATRPTIVAFTGLVLVLGLATGLAFWPAPPPQKAPEAQTDQAAVTPGIQLPDVIQDHPTALRPDAGVDGQSGPFHRERAREAPQYSEAVQTEDALKGARREALHEELEKALGSSLYANIDDPFVAEQRTTAPATASGGTGSLDVTAAMRAAAASGTPPASGDQNLQGRKNEFLTQTDRSDGYLPNQVVRPRSPYEIKAGTIIPTVLITGINSDLPGTILGQVRENVYDSVSGNYLLIPQGSKVLASYDSMVAYGQERVLVCWQRLIRPDGTSLSLDCQPGVDLAGYAGFTDQVDNHWWRVITGIALGSVLAAGVVVPQGNVAGYVPTIGQGMAANAAGSVNQAGQQITTRALNIQPTIKIRPGFSVNVLVTKDLILEPYLAGGR
jgi:type IV secretory pathway VirB10-like protein